MERYSEENIKNMSDTMLRTKYDDLLLEYIEYATNQRIKSYGKMVSLAMIARQINGEDTRYSIGDISLIPKYGDEIKKPPIYRIREMMKFWEQMKQAGLGAMEAFGEVIERYSDANREKNEMEKRKEALKEFYKTTTKGDKEKEDIIKYNGQGWTQGRIAKELGCSIFHVQYLCRLINKELVKRGAGKLRWNRSGVKEDSIRRFGVKTRRTDKPKGTHRTE